ncbi:glyoxalase bleomycin resistance protein dioxygenase [Leptolyngbya sp. Heron Island J]|uniref:VOC family protein n=1 Tax=Leptolyngbya sp. Heron Island J TaxID=1385935 RepID=UPI0003B9A19F|nr:VOC family protein [Leptolyngbya sp. Heron Island J]ESA35550.1 glyoxalase bleomycin resistance protein dioxygenase [Leptolyngbya sp. Heron Island J]
MQIAVRYFEIPVSNLERAIEFYEHVFDVSLGYTKVDGYEMALFPEALDDMGASGALAKGDVYVPGKAGPILYFSVLSIDEILARLASVSGMVLYPKKAIGNDGFVAEIEDSEGNRIALHQAGGTPPDE